MTRIEDLEAIEQPLSVVASGDGGDFGPAEYTELKLLRLLERIHNSADDTGCDGCYVVDGAVIEAVRSVVRRSAA